MRKVLYFLLIVLTCYLASEYRNLSLMVLSVMEAFFMAASFFLCFYFKHNLSLEVARRSDCVTKEEVLVCGIRAKNCGRLPVNRFQVRLRCGYGRKMERRTRRIYGGCGCGEAALQFDIVGDYCGLMRLRIEKLYVYDYLSLFSVCKKAKEASEMGIAVFPQERALRIQLSCRSGMADGLFQERVCGCGQAAHGEIRQLKEYHMGDSTRYIHWNQSARADQLWVKEFEKETDGSVLLYLDLTGLFTASPKASDAFYELLWALVGGFLENAVMVKALWYEQGRIRRVEVADMDQCRDMMLALYQMEEPSLEDGKEVNTCYADGGAFRLSLNLCWYRGNDLIFRFSEKELDEQIAEVTFVV